MSNLSELVEALNAANAVKWMFLKPSDIDRHNELVATIESAIVKELINLGY